MQRTLKKRMIPIGRSQQISIISTVVLILLMLFYLVMNVRNSASLAAQTEIISNHPFEVVISAGDVKLYVSEMSLRTGRLERHYSSDDIEFAQNKLEELSHSLEKPVARLEELYLGSREDVQILKSILELLRTEQTKYLEFCRQPDITEEKIEAYAQEHLQPVYDTALRPLY